MLPLFQDMSARIMSHMLQVVNSSLVKVLLSSFLDSWSRGERAATSRS